MQQLIKPVEEIEEINEAPKKYYNLYYEANKEQLRQKARAKVSCPLCDKIISKASLTSHLKSTLCLKGQHIKVKKILLVKVIANCEVII